MNELIIGDKTQDGSVLILDEDRLCYSVKSVSNGAIGVRTISKKLLDEWVDEYRKNPNEPVAAIRKKLVGKSNVDRYEYGYSSTLAKMAKMILGQEPKVHLSIEELRQNEFFDWMVSTGKAHNYARDVSRSYLPTLSNDAKPPTTSIWHGLREYLYGEKPQKRIYEVVSYEDLLNHYSGIDKIFGSDSLPGTFDAKRFKDCWDWAHNPDNHNSVSAAWNLYKQFMKWRDQHLQDKPEATPFDMDVLKKQAMSKALKPAGRIPYDKAQGKKKIFASDAEDQLMLRILAALRTKPFVILAGHSGTGKSRMVKKLAYMTCRDNALHEGSNPGNYCMIEVKPNWHDSTDLLGYSSSFGSNHYVVKPLIEFIQKAYAYPDVPFFVCLDEMNLAPVEQYFAEFLSALEDIHEDADAMNAYFALNANYKPKSGSAAEEVVKYTSAPLVKALEYFDSPEMLEPKFNESHDWVKTHGLTIPKNLFVVGTVNMDETTNQFSRKVLDRAFTIEMTDARFEDFGDSAKDPAPTFVEEADIDHALIDALLKGKKQYGKALSKKANDGDPNGQLENMNAIKDILADTPFVVAYRFANEYALYEDALNVLDGADGAGNSKADENAKKAFDDVVLMKLLPRIAGETAVLKAIFEGVKKSDGTKGTSGLLDLLKCSDKGDQADDTASGRKMREILRRGKRLLYLTFWP